jgi:hypothetical protein
VTINGKVVCRSCWHPGELDKDGLCSPRCRTPLGRELARRLDWISKYGIADQADLEQAVSPQ